MICRLLLAVSCLLITPSAFAKGKVDPKNIPGTVKWLCQNFEEGFAEAKLKKCGEKDKTVANAYHQCLEVVNSGLGQKRLVFSGTAAQQCVNAQRSYVQKPTKESRQAMRDACAAAVKGLKTKDDLCESPLDCGTGLACVGGKGSTTGKCLKPLGEGDNCDSDLLGGSAYIALLQESRGVCGPGLSCSEELGKPRVCTENAKDKDSVFQQAAGSSCRDSGQCKGVCESGKCKAVCGSG